MRILHYALGFSPYRTGGLTKYVMDIMVGQSKKGHEVGLLWPGKMNIINKKTSIYRHKKIENIDNFELINPLPVPLDEGIKDIKSYTKKVNSKVFVDFLNSYKPDVVHVHTLMGIYKEFFYEIKNMNIKIIFTTHDYFGLCFKVNFFFDGKICDDNNNCMLCSECNQTALSIKKITILQSPFYRIIKDTWIIKKIRKKHREKIFDKDLKKLEKDMHIRSNPKSSYEYLRLRKYYISILEIMDIIHFNSSVTKSVYEKYITSKNNVLMNITHADIKDNRRKKEFTDKIRIAYMSPIKPYKGFYILKEALDELWNEGNHKFELNIFYPIIKDREYMNVKDGYKQSELKQIFDKIDLLIAPSIWYETFGFTVLEALSYGVPVIVSNTVGAKDLLENGKYGWIIENNKDSIKKQIASLSIDDLKKVNQNILKEFSVPLFDNLIKDTIAMYGCN